MDELNKYHFLIELKVKLLPELLIVGKITDDDIKIITLLMQDRDVKYYIKHIIKKYKFFEKEIKNRCIKS